MLERIQKRCTITETFEMSQLHRHSDHRSHRCDDFFNEIVMNQSDKLHGLPPYSLSATSSLKNKRNFTIIQWRSKLNNWGGTYSYIHVLHN